MESPRRHPPPPSAAARPLDLEVTVVSAKHLKNVNWRNGDLKPYVVAYLDSDRRAATKPDDAGSTRPVWNERLALPLPLPSSETLLFLNLDVFHSKPSETPKPLVGTTRSPLTGLLDAEAFAAYASGGGGSSSGASLIRTLELRRPSGRPQGKIRIRVALRERPSPPPEPTDPTHHFPQPPPSSYFYSSNAPPLPSPPLPHTQPHSARDYRTFSAPPSSLPPYGHPPPPPQSHSYPSQYPYGSYSDSYSSGYYSPAASAYYSAPPAPAPAPVPAPASSPAHQYYDRASGYGDPSAPAGYSTGYSSYDNKPKGGRAGLATGIAVGAVAGALGGLALEEGLKHEEEKIAERVENDFSARDDYSDYRSDY
ncbi:protein SRC2 homolog [Zingiber officinale]|uniref:C2 domain-containing protein n=1 Tax=Zingiber officinale TaxID=94328 RepID=A0A8J5LUI3_ZINOF|nr:protein SRC2 homolog [Zingiber officinale]KAG6523996.1 hypothetical protein ZIOFF_013885 [Zingiber officinale]